MMIAFVNMINKQKKLARQSKYRSLKAAAGLCRYSGCKSKANPYFCKKHAKTTSEYLKKWEELHDEERKAYKKAWYQKRKMVAETA
jgi:hypothetical protein